MAMHCCSKYSRQETHATKDTGAVVTESLLDKEVKKMDASDSEIVGYDRITGEYITAEQVIRVCIVQEDKTRIADYDCLKCIKFDFERDRCFTEWENPYLYRETLALGKGVCPGYKPE